MSSCMTNKPILLPDPNDPAVILYWALKASGQWDERTEPWVERFEKDFRQITPAKKKKAKRYGAH